MTKYIRIENNIIAEVLETNEDIKTLFHPDIKWDVCTDASLKAGFILVDGVWLDPTTYVDPKTYTMLERTWRDSELIRADEELNKVQDADPKAKGTVADWRTYRKNLRSYPDVEGFPNKDLRPVSPY